MRVCHSGGRKANSINGDEPACRVCCRTFNHGRQGPFLAEKTKFSVEVWTSTAIIESSATNSISKWTAGRTLIHHNKGIE